VAKLEFEAPGQGELWHEERQAALTTRRFAPPEALNIRHLVRLAEQELGKDEFRLVGWCTDELDGLEIEPRANQKRHANLIVGRLRYATPDEPEPDANRRAEVEKAFTDPDNSGE
jgi:hypothetical protein